MWDGIEGADSIVSTPTSGSASPSTARSTSSATPSTWPRVMCTNPSYLQTSVDARVTNLRDWGIPLGRRFRALKLWFLIREQGVAGLQARLRRDLANASWLAGEVRARPRWRVLAPVALQTLCLRHEPAGLTARPSTGTPSPGPSASTAAAQPTSRPRSSTVGGWCASPSDRSRRSGARRGALGGDAGGGRSRP